MASVYIDIPTNSRWAPYVGGGLGSTIIQNAGSQGVLGYQGKVGLSYLAKKRLIFLLKEFIKVLLILQLTHQMPIL